MTGDIWINYNYYPRRLSRAVRLQESVHRKLSVDKANLPCHILICYFEAKRMAMKATKPTTSLLQNFRSPLPSEIEEDMPKSAHYRSALEPLLGAVVYIECSNWTVFDEGHYAKILLRNASVIKVPTGRCASLPISIDHVWTSN